MVPEMVPPTIAEFETLLSDFGGLGSNEGDGDGRGGDGGGVRAGKSLVLLSEGAAEPGVSGAFDGDCAGEGIDPTSIPLSLLPRLCISLLRPTSSFWPPFLAKTKGSLANREKHRNIM